MKPILDQNDFQHNSHIRKHFQSDEYLVISCAVTKINDAGKQQARNFVITNQHLFNFNKIQMQKKVELAEIMAMTVSTLSEEVVLHL